MSIIDEAYQFAQEFGLTQEEARRKGGQSTAVNPYAGLLNRFLQFGESARATRTAGTDGEGNVPPVSSIVSGNMHPEVAVPMDRGEIGNHTGQLKERIFLHTGPRVQPHEDIPVDYVMPTGVDRWSWVEFDEELAELSGLSDIYSDPERAAKSGLTRAGGAVLALPGVEEFLPDVEGYVIKLPDGVTTRLRWHMEQGRAKPQIRIANRSFSIPEAHDIAGATRKVLGRFDKPNRKLTRHAHAADKAKSLETLFNVKAAIACDNGREVESARWGVASWHLGLLAGLLLPFDVAVCNGAPGEYHSDADIVLQRT